MQQLQGQEIMGHCPSFITFRVVYKTCTDLVLCSGWPDSESCREKYTQRQM